MSVFDFGPVAAYRNTRGVDVYAPYHKGLVTVLKKLGGRFDKPSKRWRLPESQHNDDVVERLRRSLATIGPKGWDERREHLQKFATVTTTYVVVVSQAGVRVEVPEGTRIETTMNRVPDVQREYKDAGAFYLWPEVAMSTEAEAAIAKVKEKDWHRFEETTRWMRDRTVAGDINIGDANPETYNLVTGHYAIAETGFVAEADPAHRVAPVTAYVLEVQDIRKVEEPGVFELIYRYASAEVAYETLQRKFQDGLSSEMLSLAHVYSTFTTRFGDGNSAKNLNFF